MIDLVTRDPDVVSCLHRIYNTVLLNDIDVQEGSAKLAPQLLRRINREYKDFFKNAVTLSYACGFVPYYLSTVDGIRFPRCMPLGSFSWRVKTDGSRQRGLAEYEVTVLSGRIKQQQVHIFETSTPVLGSYDYDLCSPLMGVLSEYLAWKNVEQQTQKVGEWNKTKHFAVTERIDVKDQTTSGIQLLDEQRRYNLTGQHNNVMHNNLLRLTGVGTTTSVAEAYHHAVHSQFKDSDPQVGSKRASVHLMPPNTDVQELGIMDTGTAARDAKTSFQEAVYVFFGMPNINLQLAGAAHEGHGMQREQYSNVLYVQSVLERLGEDAYARCFGVESYDVSFTLRALPRFEITTVADIKLLWEIQMLTPGDIAHLRKTIMNR